MREHERAQPHHAPRRHLPIVSCTGNAEDPELAEVLRTCGADAIWSKPFPNFNDGSLQRELRQVLRAGDRSDCDLV